MTSGPAVTVVEPRRGWISIDWRELWQSRELLYFLVHRDVSVRYKQTILGVAWAVIQPLTSMLLFTLIFGRLAAIPSDGHPYAVFVFAGLLPWTFFSSAVTGAAQSLVSQQALLTKIYLPRLFVPASALGSALVDFAVSLVVLAALMAYYRIVPPAAIVLLPLVVVVLAMAALGVGLSLAALTVSYRDFRFIVPFLLQIWLFVSPVIYPTSFVPERWRWALSLNPMTGVIEAFRACLLGSPADAVTLALSGLSAVALLLYGLFYFRQTERRFADIA